MRSFIWTLALSLVLITTIGCNNDNPSTSKSKSIEPERKITVIEQLTDEIVENPNDPNVYIKRALAYRDKRLFELAIEDVNRALSIDSTVSYFHSTKGEINFMGGDLKEATKNLKKAIQYDEANTDALLKLAEIHFIMRRYEDALITTNDALKIDDKLPQGYFIKGYVYKELGDTVLAKSSFQTATEVNPDHFEAYMELGNLYAHEGDPLALEYFNTAIGLRPKSAQALYNKGMFYQAGSKFEEALEVYRTLISVDEDNFLGYYNTGYIELVEYGNYEVAMAYFDTVLTIEPSYTDALYNKGLCYEELGNAQMAEDVYRQVLAIDPQNSLAAMGLERLLD